MGKRWPIRMRGQVASSGYFYGWWRWATGFAPFSTHLSLFEPRIVIHQPLFGTFSVRLVVDHDDHPAARGHIALGGSFRPRTPVAVERLRRGQELAQHFDWPIQLPEEPWFASELKLSAEPPPPALPDGKEKQSQALPPARIAPDSSEPVRKPGAPPDARA